MSLPPTDLVVTVGTGLADLQYSFTGHKETDLGLDRFGGHLPEAGYRGAAGTSEPFVLNGTAACSQVLIAFLFYFIAYVVQLVRGL